MEAILTVGGWTGSRYFSSAVASAENRTAFSEAVMKVVQEYELDGIDFEYVPFSHNVSNDFDPKLF